MTMPTLSVKANLSPGCQMLLNAQVTRERYASAVYAALAAWADAQGFAGLTKWADAASAEETEHAHKFMAYLRDRATVTLEAVDAPPPDFGDYLGALVAALALERGVTAAIQDIYSTALAEGDGATAGLAEWFLAEQAQSEKELQTYIQRMQRGGTQDLLDIELSEEGNQ